MDWEGVFDCVNFEDVISLHQLDEDELLKGEFGSPSSLFWGMPPTDSSGTPLTSADPSNEPTTKPSADPSNEPSFTPKAAHMLTDVFTFKDTGDIFFKASYLETLKHL
jgi:hypothetical protein